MTRFRARLGLRGMALALCAFAVVLAALRPLWRESFQRFERYARVKLSEHDLYRHLDNGRGVAERFARALRSGRHEDAWELMTADFRRRTGLREFAAIAEREPSRIDVLQVIALPSSLRPAARSEGDACRRTAAG